MTLDRVMDLLAVGNRSSSSNSPAAPHRSGVVECSIPSNHPSNQSARRRSPADCSTRVRSLLSLLCGDAPLPYAPAPLLLLADAEAISSEQSRRSCHPVGAYRPLPHSYYTCRDKYLLPSTPLHFAATSNPSDSFDLLSSSLLFLHLPRQEHVDLCAPHLCCAFLLGFFPPALWCFLF